MNVAGQSDKDRVLSATDLVSLVGEFVQLRRKGREHVGLCPFHDDHSPSLHIVSHKGEPFYKCFSCGAGGNAIDFVINYHKMSFVDALRHLADRAGIELTPRAPAHNAADTGEQGPKRGELLEANIFAQQFFQRVLKHEQAGAIARDAIAQRGISDAMALRFGIGAAPNDWEGLTNLVRKRDLDLRAFREAGLIKERTGSISGGASGGGGGLRDTFVNRLTFTITDQLGRPIAFGGRILNPEDQPKYLNSPESRLFEKGKTLYALHQAQKSIRDHGVAIVAEGYIDAIALHQHGFTNSVATLGTALTRDHARILQRLCSRLVVLFDGDEAGQRAAERATETLVQIFFEERCDLDICILPSGLDPDDLLRQEEGRAKLNVALSASEPALSFLMRRFASSLSKTTGVSERQQMVEEMLQRLTDLGLTRMSGLRKRLVLPRLAQQLNMSLEALIELLPRRRARVNIIEQNLPNREGAEHSSGVRVDVVGNPLSRKRAEAEQNVLAYILFEPAVLAQPIDAGDGHMLPLTEAYVSEAFLDPACRAIYAAIHDMVEAGEAVTVPGVQQQLADNHHRAAVATLFFRGSEMCCDDERSAREQFASVAAAFDRDRDGDVLHNRFTELKSSPASGWSRDVIEQRRQHGDDLAVMPRRARA